MAGKRPANPSMTLSLAPNKEPAEFVESSCLQLCRALLLQVIERRLRRRCMSRTKGETVKTR
ncbi:hypothetical protein PP4_32450 [Pseudomonas putida NBRC 14164]|uniref:Uncharacterized protein n=1 Tax=Pseudomonas putida NBRC 14164 TaxID=1211579 RepID=A0ABM7EHF0_PSEPU|nr:hypothetical protein PP4_32450 [Pseudomonas putida NBRC 14164]